MKQVLFLSLLLMIGMVFSQLLPWLPHGETFAIDLAIQEATMVLLSFIMIHVGLEFDLDRDNLMSYVKDYLVAFTTATFPWIFCAIYFVYAFEHSSEISTYNLWTETLLISRFSAPTSAGVLFTMLAACGLARTWCFSKARNLAIFDDLDTILLLIPLKMMILGFNFGLVVILAVVFVLLYLAWKYMHHMPLPFTWPYVLTYAILITSLSEGIYFGSKMIEGVVNLHIEVILPAFVFGCCIAWPDQCRHQMESVLHRPREKKAHKMISYGFMFLVGLNMPTLVSADELSSLLDANGSFWDKELGGLSVASILWHVSWITFLSNVGKMFPFFCYRKEASWRERLSVALAMCPRGEVGAGIIAISISLGAFVNQGVVIVATLSLGLNLLLTGVFILCIEWLLHHQKHLIHK